MATLSLALAIGCGGSDELEGATTLTPPETDTFDPSAGPNDSGYATTGGVTTGAQEGGGDGGADGGTGGVPACADPDKRCTFEFGYPDSGESSVEVLGDFASDGWTVGAAMASDGARWTVTLPLPWDTPVAYKFRIDGETWALDPANMTTVPDGSGGENSLVEAMTCQEFTCEPSGLVTFDWRDSITDSVFVDPSDRAGHGGDWAGLTHEIEQAYFEDLGGTRTTLSADADTFVYRADFANDVVYVAINRADSARTASGVPDGQYTDELTGQAVSGGLIRVPARSAYVLAAR